MMPVWNGPRESMIQILKRWWRKRQRRLDLTILANSLAKTAKGNLANYYHAIKLHMSIDSAWRGHDYDPGEDGSWMDGWIRTYPRWPEKEEYPE